MSDVKASMHVTVKDGGQTVECDVRCNGRHAVVTFTPDDVITEVPEQAPRPAGD